MRSRERLLHTWSSVLAALGRTVNMLVEFRAVQVSNIRPQQQDGRLLLSQLSADEKLEVAEC